MSPRVATARRLTLWGLAFFALLLSVELFSISKLQVQTRAFLWVIWVGPLLVFLPGLARGAWKTYMWLCFALMIYFCMTVTELFGPHKELTDALELVAISVVFVAAMFYGRWRRQELANAEDPE